MAGEGPCRAEQFIEVDAVAGECDDVDVVTPAGAGDAPFEDPVDGHLPGRRNDRVPGGCIPGRGALPRSCRHGDPHAQGWVAGLLANLMHADRVEVEHDTVIDVDRGDVTDHVGEMLRGDVYADGVGVGVLGRAPYPVGGQQNPALEDEVAGVGRAGEPVQERFGVCRIRYSCVGAPIPLFAAAERAMAWIWRNTASPELTPASLMRAGRGTSPAVAGMRCRSAGTVCRLGAATPAAHPAPTRIRPRRGAGTRRRSNAQANRCRSSDPILGS